MTGKLRRRGLVSGEPVKMEGAFINRPRTLRSIRTHLGNLAFEGEVAGFISPSSAEGISYAIKSGFLLVESINTHFPLFQERYRKMTTGLRRNIWMKNRRLPFMYNKMLRRLIISSGIFSMKIR